MILSATPEADFSFITTVMSMIEDNRLKLCRDLTDLTTMCQSKTFDHSQFNFMCYLTR